MGLKWRDQDAILGDWAVYVEHHPLDMKRMVGAAYSTAPLARLREIVVRPFLAWLLADRGRHLLSELEEQPTVCTTLATGQVDAPDYLCVHWYRCNRCRQWLREADTLRTWSPDHQEVIIECPTCHTVLSHRPNYGV